MRIIHFLLIVVASIAYVAWSGLVDDRSAIDIPGPDYAFQAAALGKYAAIKINDLARYVVFVALVLGHAVCFPPKRPTIVS